MSPIACRKTQEFTEDPAPNLSRGANTPQVAKGSSDVVDRYLVGNFHERLDLWLTHRDLRPTLSRLDKAMKED